MTILRWETWLHGLGSAAIGGGASAVTAMIVEPKVFNIEEGLGKVGTMFLVSAIFGAAMYLKGSPLPAIKERADTEFFTKKGRWPDDRWPDDLVK